MFLHSFAKGLGLNPQVGGPEEFLNTLLELVASANLADKSWVTDQYDRYVRGNTVLSQPEDSGMIRVDEETGRGVAIATDCNGRFAKLDPYAGAQLALAESYRNVCVTGAVPLAVTNCLNFGSPEDPEVNASGEPGTTSLAAKNEPDAAQAEVGGGAWFAPGRARDR